MVSRRIVIAALAATALVGLLFGAMFGLVGGGDDASPVAKSSSTGPTPGAPSATPTVAEVSAGPTSASPSPSASTSASKSPSASPSKPPLAPGRFYHVTAAGKAMDVYGGDKGGNTPIILFQPKPAQANQQWAVQDAGNGLVYVVSRVSNKCLDIRDGKAVQDDCGDARQQWKAQPSGNGYVLLSRDGKQALGVGEQVKGQQGLKLVPAGQGIVWGFAPLG